MCCFLYKERWFLSLLMPCLLFVGIYLSSVPPENYWYQNKLQKPRVLGCSRPVLRSLPSKPLWRRGQGRSAGSSRCLEGVVCGSEVRHELMGPERHQQKSWPLRLWACVSREADEFLLLVPDWCEPLPECSGRRLGNWTLHSPLVVAVWPSVLDCPREP